MRAKFHHQFLFILLISVSVHLVAFAEGTKEIQPVQATPWYLELSKSTQRSPFALYSAGVNERLQFTVKEPGEIVYYGIGNFGGSGVYRIKDPNDNIVVPEANVPIAGQQGYINSWDEAVIGPSAIPGNTGGYDAKSFTPAMTGDFYIEFDFTATAWVNSRNVELFDITVATVGNTEALGRVWSKSWQFTTNASTSQYTGLLYPYSTDSILTAINFNGMAGYSFQVSCNPTGCSNTGNFTADRASIDGRHLYPDYKIFLNEPDIDLFPSGTLGALIPPVQTTSYCDGTVDILINVNKAGSAEITLNINPLPGLQPEDVVLTQPVNIGINTLVWDGLNGLGNPVPNGSSFQLIVKYVNGLTHLPLYDVEYGQSGGNNWQGLIISIIRPLPPPPWNRPKVFWDDFTNLGGTINLSGCTALTGCHSWGMALGDVNTINTWWFATSGDSSNVDLQYKRFPGNLGSISGVNTICQGVSGIPFSVVPDPSSTSYTWSYSGTGVTIIGTGSSVTLNFAANATSGNLSVQGWNPDCGNGPASSKSITVDPLPDPSGVISGTANVCLTQTYTYSVPVIANAASYSWSYSGTGATIVPPGNTNTIQVQFSPTATAGQLSVTGVNSCGNGTASSLTITVAPFPGAAGAISGPSPVCQTETGVVYSVAPITNATSYSWSLPPGVSGTSATNTITVDFSQTAATGNIMVFGTNSCGDGTSTSRLITVNPRAYPAGPITGPPGICQGSSATYSIDPISNATSYAWSYSGTGVTLTPSGTSATINFSGSATSGVLSVAGANGICSNGDPSVLNIAVGYQTPSSLTICNNLTTMGGKSFTLTGGTPLGGIYSGPGVVGSTFNPAAAGIGTHSITYSFTNAPFGCTSSATATITVVASPSFVCGGMLTDIREPGRQYRTVQIGSQCWMAQNLDVGTRIADNQMQKDNCVPEKFCYANMDANCALYGGLYQWNELMSYTRLEEVQGICPPGWHIPSEDDWNTLFNFLGDESTAGSAMKASGFSGFNAPFSGGVYKYGYPYYLGTSGMFWASTQENHATAWAHAVNPDNPSVARYPSKKINALSVRCLKD